MSVAIIAASVLTAFAKNDDPVLMTINGKDVTLSEFEYLYKKNNSQQMQQQSIDEYVDMFVTYKLKVADAEAAGLDTAKTFLTEYNGYRNELAMPYMRNNELEDSIVKDVYNRMKEDVDVSHIMLPLQSDPALKTYEYNRLDSIRTAIINGASFEENALKYSIDGAARFNKGRMGFISANKLPYTFEDAAYNTPVGEISPIIETFFGIHIVKVHARRPNPGQVLTQHILKLTQGKSPEDAIAQRVKIDSIYALVKGGADFSDMAKRESEDPGSARNGGMLPWFGSGEMVPQFEQAAFALKNGEISEPFATNYGYHIIHRIDHKDVPSLEEARKAILDVIKGDARGNLAERTKLEELKKVHNARFNDEGLAEMMKALEANNGYDSTFIKTHANSALVVAKVADKNITLGEIIAKMPTTAWLKPQGGYDVIVSSIKRQMDVVTLEHEISELDKKYPEFRNLINEYRDGMLLFEISNLNVWEKASKDKEGLEAFFQANKYKYAWEGPKFKGFVIFATNDSVQTEVTKYLEANNIDNDSITTALRKKFGREVKVERVIAGKGENEIIDNIAFNGKAPELKGRWTCYMPYHGRVISWPEEAADVRGPVTSDYQAQLEKEWVASLYKKYPVKINKKVLKKVK